MNVACVSITTDNVACVRNASRESRFSPQEFQHVAPGDRKRLARRPVELDGSPCQSLTIAGGDVLEFLGAEATFPGGITNAGNIVGSYTDASNIHGFIATPQ